MSPAVIRRFLELALPLVPACVLAHWLAAGAFSWAPALLGVLVCAALQRTAWLEQRTPRRPLDGLAEVRGWIETMASECGAGEVVVGVVDQPAGEFSPPESLIESGEILLAADDVAAGETYPLLGHAARQLALMTAPPAHGPAATALVGAALGLITGLSQRLGGPWTLPAAGLAAVALMALVAWRLTEALDRRGQLVTGRANELLGWLRQTHPEAFAELARKQGLAVDESGQQVDS